MTQPRRNARRNIVRKMWALGLLLVAVACSGGPQAPDPLPSLPQRVGEVSEAPRAEERPVRELRLALVGEVRGEVEPCGCPTLPFGGFPRRQRLLDQLASEEPTPIFQLDAGEALLKGQSTSAPDPDRVKLVVDLQRKVGVMAWAPGPTDLRALGLEGLRAEAARPDGPRIISANWVDQAGHPLLAPSAVLERGGLRMGVIGLSALPADRALQEVVRGLDPVESAKAALAALPADLDLVVALSNLADAEADRVAAEVPGLAAVLSTRGRAFDEPRAARPGSAPVIEAPDRGRYLQVVRLRLGSGPGQPLLMEPTSRDWRDLESLRKVTAPSDESRTRTEALEARFTDLGRGRNLGEATPVPLGAELDGATALADTLQAFHRDALQEAAEAAAQRPAAAEAGYGSSGACVNCHINEFARWAYSPHAKAWESLILRRATTNSDCVACHTTGFGQPGGLGALTDANLRKFKGVQCEACHGPMGGHPDDDHVQATPLSEARCRTCHDEANSPNFDYKSYLQRATCQGGTPTITPPPLNPDGSLNPASSGP